MEERGSSGSVFCQYFLSLHFFLKLEVFWAWPGFVHLQWTFPIFSVFLGNYILFLDLQHPLSRNSACEELLLFVYFEFASYYCYLMSPSPTIKSWPKHEVTGPAVVSFLWKNGSECQFRDVFTNQILRVLAIFFPKYVLVCHSRPFHHKTNPMPNYLHLPLLLACYGSRLHKIRTKLLFV